jgi:hypothetical protein
VANSGAWALVSQSDASRFKINVSAGLHTVGLSTPSRIACAESSEPLAISLTVISGCAFWNSATLASIQSFFSVPYSRVISVLLVGTAGAPPSVADATGCGLAPPPPLFPPRLRSWKNRMTATARANPRTMTVLGFMMGLPPRGTPGSPRTP